MKIRLKDIKDKIKYLVTSKGPNRKARRKEVSLSRIKGTSPHGKAKATKKKKDRKLQKARRAQARKGKAP